MDKTVLWHSDEDGPEGDVEVGRVQKENMEAEKGEKLQLTSPLAIDPIGGHKEEDQAVHRNEQACRRYHWQTVANVSAQRKMIPLRKI